MSKPTAIFRALANKTRLDILTALQKGEMTVSELIAETGAQQSAISHSLSRLVTAGLVKLRRQNKFTFASLDHGVTDPVLALLRGRLSGLGPKAAAALEDSAISSRRMVDVIPLPAFIVQGAKLYHVNNAAAKLFGFRSPREMAGRSLSEMISPETTALVLERRQRLLRGLTAPPMEHPITRRDGKVVWVESNTTLVKLDGGYGFFIVLRDMTEQKTRERGLQERVNWLHLIGDAADCGVMVTDPKDTVIYANARQAAFLGVKRDVMLGRKFYSFLKPQGKLQALSLLRQMKSGFSGTFSKVMLPIHAKPIRVHFSMGPIYDERGKYSGQLSIVMKPPGSSERKARRVAARTIIPGVRVS